MSDGEDCGGVIAAPAPSRRRNRKLWKTSVRLVLEKQPRSVRQEVMIETEEIEASDINQVKFEKKQVSMNLKKGIFPDILIIGNDWLQKSKNLNWI